MENKKITEPTQLKKVSINSEMANAVKPPIPKKTNFTVKQPLNNTDLLTENKTAENQDLVTDTVQADSTTEIDTSSFEYIPVGTTKQSTEFVPVTANVDSSENNDVLSHDTTPSFKPVNLGSAEDIHAINTMKQLDFNELQQRRKNRRRAVGIATTIGVVAVLSAIIAPVTIVYSQQQSQPNGNDNNTGGNNNNDSNNANQEVIATLNSAKAMVEKEGFVTTKSEATQFVSATDVNVDNVHSYINIPQLKSLSDVKVEVIETTASSNGTTLEVSIKLTLENQTSIAKVSLGGFLDNSRDADLILDLFLATKPLLKAEPSSMLASSVNESNLQELFVNLPTSNNSYNIIFSVQSINASDNLGFLNIIYTGKITRGDGKVTSVSYTYVIHGFKKA